MIVLADEPVVEILAALPEKSWLRPWFPVDPDGPSVEMLRGKVDFVPACVSAGVPVPAFRVVDDADGLAAAGGALGFPLVIKGNQGFAGASVRRADNPSELRAHYAALRAAQASREAPFLVQRFITGGVVSTQMVLDHGRPLCWNSALKAETHPGPFGPSCGRR